MTLPPPEPAALTVTTCRASRRLDRCLGLLLAMAWWGCEMTTRADYAADGQGLQPVLAGDLPNAALFLETRHTWINTAAPDKPYQLATEYVLPTCETIPVARLVLTVWGGTADYVCQMDVRVNDTALPGADPLLFGTTTDSNPSFAPDLPNAYGSGFGVWLVTIPVPGHLLHRDGSVNLVEVTVNTPDSFDGRMQQITLIAVHQSAALSNHLQYVIAEGSGDIYRAPTETRVSSRTLPLAVHPAGALSARLTALYTYGDIGQNDHLYLNETQLGGDDVARYDKTTVGLDFGPDVASFDVLDLLTPNNTVTFTVAEGLVPDVREFSLRPQLAVLEVVRPAATPTPTLDIALHTAIRWPATSEDWTLEFRADSETGEWTPVPVQPEVIAGQNTVLLPPTAPRQFYRLRLAD